MGTVALLSIIFAVPGSWCGRAGTESKKSCIYIRALHLCDIPAFISPFTCPVWSGIIASVMKTSIMTDLLQGLLAL
jgi:hypothetical protein